MQTNSSSPRRRRSGRTDQRFGNVHGRFSKKKSFGQKKNRFSGRGGRKQSQKINIEQFITQSQQGHVQAEMVIEHTFADFGFVSQLEKNIATLNYTTPTPIQDQVIPHILKGADVVGLANTGTGKTGAFLLPLLHLIAHGTCKKVLIITPTRELAVQIDTELKKFAQGMNIYSTVCIGGMPLPKQISQLKRRPQVVIGTPGRLQDLNKRNILRFDSVDTVVLDEVDQMFDMGFVDEITSMLSMLPKKHQSLFFSATLPPSITALIERFSTNPVMIKTTTSVAARNVQQELIRVKDHTLKLDMLKELLARPEFRKVLIFSETKREVEQLARILYTTGFKVDSIHGDKRQRQREKSLSHFRADRITILVATDVAARGLDISEVSHVINYTIPQTYDAYIHRIGRTGRGHKKGNAVTFV